MPSPPVDERAEEPRLALGEAALRDEPGELAADRTRPPRRTAPASTSREHDRDLEPAQEERRELASPSARRRRGRRAGILRGSASGTPTPRFDAPLDDVERVDRRLRLRAREGARRARPPRRDSPPRASTSPRPRSARARGTARAPGRGRRRRPARAPCARPRPRRRDRPRAALPVALLDALDEQLERLVEELDRLEQWSTSPSSSACVAPIIRFWLSGLSTMQLHRRLGADEPRHELRAAPAGKSPRSTSGKAKWRTFEASVRTSQWSAISSPPPSAAPLTAASVGNGSSRSRPKSSWPASAALPGELGRDARGTA